MAYELHIPDCILKPSHPFHFPAFEKPLRIHIQGPLVSIQKLISEAQWDHDYSTKPIPQRAALEFARIAYRQVYRRDPQLKEGDLRLRQEYCGWTNPTPWSSIDYIDYYGVTFDHFVPADDADPETLQINIIELEVEEGPYANGIMYAEEAILFELDPLAYLGKRILAVPRCCQRRKGTRDRDRINKEVIRFEEWLKTNGKAFRAEGGEDKI